MSGAEWRQQQELEEHEQWLESRGIDIEQFVSGQQFAKHGCPLPKNSNESFKRGYNAQKGLEEIQSKV